MNLLNKLIYHFLLIFCLVPLEMRAETKEWDNNLELRVNRCFKIRDITVSCEDGFIDGSGRPTLKEISILARNRDGDVFRYSYGRALPATMCEEHLEKIRKLMLKTTQACITGDAETPIKKNETSAYWLSFETAKGEVHRNR